MDIKDKLLEIKKLLELQTFQINETRNTLIKLLRELFYIYMYYGIDERKGVLKHRRELKSILRLLLVHVDSENHSNNGEKILMINLIKILKKKINTLFSFYPNIWKGNNACFFFYISFKLADSQLMNTFFSILKNSFECHKSIYISLLLFHSNDFTTRIKTLKYIFGNYVLCIPNEESVVSMLTDEVNNLLLYEDKTFTNFLIKEENDNNITKSVICCFFFSILSELLENDYYTYLTERKRSKDEKTLVDLDLKNEEETNGTDQIEYINEMIQYATKKNVLNSYFKLEECRIFKKEENFDEEDLNKENSSDNEHDSNRSGIIKKEYLYYNARQDQIVLSAIEDHYNVDFMNGLFIYVKNIIYQCEEMYVLKKNVLEIKNTYVCCCLIQCISILFNLCCLNNKMVPLCYEVIKNIKDRFLNCLDFSVLIAISKFTLFFSTSTDFESVSNILLEFILKEYNNYLHAVAFFDFILNNRRALSEKSFFFKKAYLLIMKIYFYYYRMLKGDLIPLFHLLIGNANYWIMLSMLLNLSYLLNLNLIQSKQHVFSTVEGEKNQMLVDYKRFFEEDRKFSEIPSGSLENVQAKEMNNRRLVDVHEDLHKYMRLYFDNVLEKKQNNRWLPEITKILLHKLSTVKTFDTLDKKSVKEILKGLKKIIKRKCTLLLMFKNDFINLLKRNMEVSFLINRKLLHILGENIQYLQITYEQILEYYVTLHGLFCGDHFEDLKYWTSLIFGFTNIAINCYDLSEDVLNTYIHFLSQPYAPMMLKNIVSENMILIKNISYNKIKNR